MINYNILFKIFNMLNTEDIRQAREEYSVKI